MEKKLPDNFYWGGSVSSFQTEGARNEGGKGVCIYDVRPTDPEFSDWSVGIDEYHRYDEDIALMKDMLVYVSNDLVIELNTGCLLMNKIYMG